MHKLHKLKEQIDCEFRAAEDYVHCASKSEDFVKDTYKSIAHDELEHVEKLIDIGDKYNFEKDSAEHTIWKFIVEEAELKVTNIKAKLSMID